MNIIRKPIYPDFSKLSYKENNFYEYSPYIIYENKNIIDKTWYNTLSDYCKILINNRIEFELSDVEIPHQFQSDNKDKFLYKMYRSYIDSFDFNLWYNSNLNLGSPDTKIIKITDDIKKVLINMYENQEKYSNELDEFKNTIQNELISGDEYFIKLSGTSGKNEKGINKFSKANDIISHLASVKLFVDQEYKREKDTYLILIKWNDKIELRNEFRIFVFNKKITGISQQSKKLFNYSEDELEIFQEAFSTINFIKNIPYNNCILDVYVDLEFKKCILIEINPFGAHCGAGSSLFKWDDDYELLHSNSEYIEFRYLSIINI
jgi:hypothetical protein